MAGPFCSTFDVFCLMDAHQGQAAWLQAVLSAAAIFLSVWLQDRSVRRRERADLLEWVAWLEKVAAEALSLLEAVEARVRVSPPRQDDGLQSHRAPHHNETMAMARQSARLSELLGAISVTDAPTVAVAEAFLDTRSVLMELPGNTDFAIALVLAGETEGPLGPAMEALTRALDVARAEKRRLQS